MKIVTAANFISIDGVSYPKNAYKVKKSRGSVVLASVCTSEYIKVPVEGTTIDGAPVASRNALKSYFDSQGFSNGGGTGAGVQSVNGDTGPDVVLTTSDVGAATAAQGALAQTALQNITGLVSQGTNVTITGSGTAGDPYVINSANTTYTVLTEVNAQNPASTTAGLITGQRLASAIEGRIISVAANKTLAITDRLTYQNVTVESTITVPPNSAVAFPIGTEIQGFGQGVSTIFAAGAGVTIHSKNSLLSTVPNTAWALKKASTDVWHLIGDLQ